MDLTASTVQRTRVFVLFFSFRQIQLIFSHFNYKRDEHEICTAAPSLKDTTSLPNPPKISSSYCNHGVRCVEFWGGKNSTNHLTSLMHKDTWNSMSNTAVMDNSMLHWCSFQTLTLCSQIVFFLTVTNWNESCCYFFQINCEWKQVTKDVWHGFVAPHLNSMLYSTSRFLCLVWPTLALLVTRSTAFCPCISMPVSDGFLHARMCNGWLYAFILYAWPVCLSSGF